MERSRSDGLEAVARRHDRLPVEDVARPKYWVSIIQSPAGQRTVGPQRQGVAALARVDGHEVIAGRYVRLSILIVAPGDELAGRRGPRGHGNQADQQRGEREPKHR